jgi:molybdopterin-synthase adenylyltransferase
LSHYAEENFVSLAACLLCGEEFSIPLREIEEIALASDLSPLRYRRNQSSINLQEQLKLFRSHVAIIGCGGLGGHIAGNLARIGIGSLALFDHDAFEEHNINRQHFSSMENIGRYKVDVVKEECEKIHPSIHITPYKIKFKTEEDFPLIRDADVVVDALDDHNVKLSLSVACKKERVDFVHGAIAGFSAQLSTCSSLEHIYREETQGAEMTTGNLSFTASFAASLESAETVKLLLGKGETFRDKILMADLLDNEFMVIENKNK